MFITELLKASRYSRKVFLNINKKSSLFIIFFYYLLYW